MSSLVTPARIAGVLLTVVGIVAVLMPSWFAPLTKATGAEVDAFEAVEQRVRGGMVFGLGLVLLAHQAPRPWSSHVASAIFYWTFGVLAVRVFGILVEGSSPKQWMWVVVEAVILALPAAWLWRTASAG
jgi:hypothetical protein